MIYLDACYIAKLYLPEPDSPAVRAAVEADGLVVCGVHGQVEVLSVLLRKRREKSITAEEYDDLCAQFEVEAASSKYLWLPLGPAVLAQSFAVAKRLPESVFLRAGDALHLSAASEKGFTTIHSSDKHLLAAAPHFGLAGITL